MSEKPIIFSAPMVRAILDGKKTQTRRVIKPQPEFGVDRCVFTPGGWAAMSAPNEYGVQGCRCGNKITPIADVGDILWVREAFCPRYFDDDSPAYRADYHKERINSIVPEPKWKPSIHMPRAVARIFLKVTDVRAERLQEISCEDVIAEGIKTACGSIANAINRDAYRELWDDINSKNPGFLWANNPWVWVYTFERVK